MKSMKFLISISFYRFSFMVSLGLNFLFSVKSLLLGLQQLSSLGMILIVKTKKLDVLWHFFSNTFFLKWII
jgi:hypothetical protein